MLRFLLTFFLVYGGVHAYAFWKAKWALDLGVRAGVVLSRFMFIMVLAPVVVRLTERAGLEVLPRILAYVGYSWMGMLFLFLSASVVLDIYRLLVFLVQWLFSADPGFMQISAKASFFLAVGLSVLISYYGYFEATTVRSQIITVRSSKIPKEIGRIRIAQISDVHLGLIVREKRLRMILDKVKEAAPDLLVSTGDLVDGQMDDLDGLAGLFKEIEPRYGKYAVTGNHEFYAGLDHSLGFTEKAGFTVLRGEVVLAPPGIHIAGVDDAAGPASGRSRAISEKDLLARIPQNRFSVFLKHRPVVEPAALGLFDLQLSGHVHKGQIFPFNLVTYIPYPVRSGETVLEKNSRLYVNRGSGTWGPPIRFLAPPEVTIIDLMSDEED